MIKNEEIVAYLNDLSEDEMIEQVIVPLYKKRFHKKFHDIEFTGRERRTDQGIDITYYEIARDTKGKEYSGIQVKLGDINTGKTSNGIASIIIQAQQAFNKPIHNVKDKSDYFIRTYIVMTTGIILPEARQQIVSQFKDKNIRFIEGKDLVEWINDDFYYEFIKIYGIEDDEDENHDEKALNPLDTIMNFIEDNYPDKLNNLKDSFYPLNNLQKGIIVYLLLNNSGTLFDIAKYMATKKDDAYREITDLMSDNLIDAENDDIFLISNEFDDWNILEKVARKQIDQLDVNQVLDDDAILEDILREISDLD